MTGRVARHALRPAGITPDDRHGAATGGRFSRGRPRQSGSEPAFGSPGHVPRAMMMTRQMGPSHRRPQVTVTERVVGGGGEQVPRLASQHPSDARREAARRQREQIDEPVHATGSKTRGDIGISSAPPPTPVRGGEKGKEGGSVA